MEIEAQGRKIICRRSHRQGDPSQPPLVLSEAEGALPLCSCLGAALPISSGFSLAQVAPRSQPPRAPRALYFDSAPAGVCLPHAQNCATTKTNYKCRVFIVSFSTQCFQHLDGTIYRILPAPQRERQSLGGEME